MRSTWPAALAALAALNARLPGALGATPVQGGHPEPRVVVDVVHVAGPHKRAEIEREARRALWGKIIACYRPAAAKRPGLRGEATLRFRVGADGSVGGLRAEQSTLGDGELVACFQGHVAGLALPKAGAESDVAMQIHVAPGDRPGAPRAAGR
ncbi:MAG TPA: AgmX/PglI C-terminal domain-containing protein [Polyangiaceae bacterium]|nr:AgmX/PglI C-terminal domain-containing protein [Polyangiaceae bacterium]